MKKSVHLLKRKIGYEPLLSRCFYTDAEWISIHRDYNSDDDGFIDTNPDPIVYSGYYR